MGAVTNCTTCCSSDDGEKVTCDQIACIKLAVVAQEQIVSRAGSRKPTDRKGLSPSPGQSPALSPRDAAKESIAKRRDARGATLPLGYTMHSVESDAADGEGGAVTRKSFARPPRAASPRASPGASTAASPRPSVMKHSPRSAFGNRAPDQAELAAALEAHGCSPRGSVIYKPARAPRIKVEGMNESDDDIGVVADTDKTPYHDELLAQDIDNVFLIACATGDFKAVEMCFEKGALPNIKDKLGYQAGYHAAMSGNVDVLKLVLDRDVHSSYDSYFDCTVTHDEMTPLMTLLRHGFTEVCEFLVNEKGCKLRLLGARFGVGEAAEIEKGKSANAEEGLDEPIESWLLVVPELCHISQVPEPHEVSMPHRQFTVTKPVVTQKDYEITMQKRIQARNFVRTHLLASKTISPAGFQNSRRALNRGIDKKILSELKSSQKAMAHSSSQQSALVHSSSQQSVVTMSSQKSMVLAKTSSSATGQFAELEAFSDDSGEYWENHGRDFTNEREVDKNIPLFKRSIFWHLGAQRVRELLRIAKVSEAKQGEMLFKEGAPLNCLHVLKQGVVTLTANPKDSAKEERSDISASPESKQGMAVKVLDLSAFMDATNVHRSTAVVKSETAAIFLLTQEDVAEHCGHALLQTIVHNSLSNSILQLVPHLRTGFTAEEKPLVAGKLHYQDLQAGHVIVNKGQRLDHVVVIQRGQLRIVEGPKTRTIHVDSDHDHWAKGQRWVPYYIIGVRFLVFDIASTVTIDVEEGMAEAWILDTKRIDAVLMEGNLLQHLQISTYVMYVWRCVMFKGIKMTDPRLRRLIMISQKMEFWCEEDLIVQGEEGDSLYIMVEGTIAIRINDKEVETFVANIDHDKVHYFGELAVLDHSKRTATIRVKSASATAIRVDVHGIDEAFGSVEALLEEQGLDRSLVLQMANNRLKGRSGTLDVAIHEDVVAEIPNKGGRVFKPLKSLECPKTAEKILDKKKPKKVLDEETENARAAIFGDKDPRGAVVNNKNNAMEKDPKKKGWFGWKKST